MAQSIPEEILKQKVMDIPPGIKQQVALYTCLMPEPEVILLDEPTSGVDPENRRKFWMQIYDLKKAGKTVLVTTHNLDESEYADRVIIIDSGRKVVDQRLDELQRGARLIVELDAEPERARPVLEAVGPLSAVSEELAGGRWRYALTDAEGNGPELARAAADAGFALHALYPERRDLETVFAEAGEVRHAA